MSTTVLQQRGMDAAFMVVLGTITLAGLDRTYDGPRYLVVGVIGLCIGAIVGVLTERLRASTSAAIGVVVYLLTCGPVVLPETTIAAVLPSAQTLAGITDGTVNGWRDMLTTQPPLPTVSGPLLVPPFLLGLAAGLAGVLVARLRLALAPLVPVLSLVALVILFGTELSKPPTLFACLFVALTLLWGTLRHHRRIGPTRTEGSALRRLATPTVLLVVASLSVAAFDSVVSPVSAEDRYVLRDHVLPPFDPSAYPSPLSGFRQYEKRLRDDVLFTVSGLPAGARLRLATMDSYDGVVWNVVNGNGGPADGSGVFDRVGSRIPTDSNGQSAHLQITIGAYSDIWMPTAGALRKVTFEGDRADGLTESFRYNTRTSIGVIPTGLGTGDSYSMDVVIPAEPSAQDLAGLSFGSVTLPDLTGVPDEVAAVASDWAGGGSVTSTHLQTIVDALKHGAFSDGDQQSGVASPPGHGANRIRGFLNAPELVGDAEQYSATLGLMARALGVPARVVLGAIPPAKDFDGKVTGAMVSAWVEVYFAGAGWVPFFPTPDVNSKPKKVTVKPDQNVEGQVLDPPVVQAQPPRPLPPPQAEEPNENVNCLLGWLCFNGLPKWAQWTIKYVAPPVLAITALLFAIVMAKAVRRRRRRRRGTPVARVCGAWQEFVDRLRDQGVRCSAYDTRLDIAARLGGTTAQRLAVLADAAVFGPGDPSMQYARDVWATLPRAVHEVNVGRSRWLRFLAAINPNSLRPDARTIAMLAAAARRRTTRRSPPRLAAQAASPQPRAGHHTLAPRQCAGAPACGCVKVCRAPRRHRPHGPSGAG
ncbi:MAG TPA: transglutaminaseTgpA domain-containing protein [Micromonosporaceae bacterium]|jgi:hypothetical protein